MSKRMVRHSISLGTVVLLSAASLAAARISAAAESTREVDVVASGLDNPRGLAFAPNGTLYVVEAGRGGEGPCFPGPEGDACFGLSGAITSVRHGHQTRVVTGLPSLANPEGFSAIGPHDLALHGSKIGFVAIGLGGSPSFRDQYGPDAADLGKLLRVHLAKGTWESVADLVAYEASANPDGSAVDSNPYAALSVHGLRIVPDAGGNDLLGVNNSGEVSTVAVFPERLVDAPPFLGLPPGAQIPMQEVPTTVALGPDGALYVGQLTGFPFPVGGARVYRVVPGHEPEIFAEGFTNIIDIAFGPSDGQLYVLEFATNGLLSGDQTGALLRVDHDGSLDVIASAGLVAPSGLAFGPDGAAYVTNFGTSPGDGHVVRIPIEP